MATIDAKKLLPPSKKAAAIEKQKFLVPLRNISTNRISTGDLRPVDKETKTEESLSLIKKKISKLSFLLNESYLIEKREKETRRKAEEKRRYEQKEKNLEKKVKKNQVSPNLISSIPGQSIFDRINRFIGFTLLGYLFNKYGELLPKLLEFGKFLKPVADFIESFAKNLLKGVVDFIEFGYKAYDQTRDFAKQIGGEGAQKTFDEFSKNLNTLLNGAIGAAMLIASTAPKSPRGAAGGLGAGVGTVAGGKYGYTPEPLPKGVKPGTIEGRSILGSQKKAARAAEKASRKTAGAAIRRGLTQETAEQAAKQLGTQGAKQSLKSLTAVPIIGALIGFIIDTVVFREKPSRAAAGAVGSAIGQGIGIALAGGTTFGIGAGIGMFVGGFAGDWIGKALYDTLTGYKQPPLEGRAEGGQVTRGGQSSVTPSRRLKTRPRKAPPRIQPQKTQPGKDIGGKLKIEELYGKDEPGKRSALRALRKSSDDVKKMRTINGLAGSMFGAGIDMALGQKPDKNLSRNLGNIFGSVIASAVDMELNNSFGDISKTIAMANGGVVPSREIGRSLSIGERIGNFISRAFAVSIESSAARILQNLRNEINLEDGTGGGPGPGDGGGGGGQIPGDAPPEVKAMLEAISAGEGSWDSVNPSTTVPGLSNMTIADARKAAIAKGINQLGGSGAMGKWQQMPEFILGRAKDAGLDPNKDKFTPENQTKIARMLMASVYPGGEAQLVKDAQKDPMSAAAKLRGTWPSLPGGSQANTTEKKFRENFAKSLQTYKSPSSVPTKGSYASVLPKGNPQFTSGFGSRWGREHRGIDIGVDANSPVTALQDGKVVAIYKNFGGNGVGVVVQHSDGTKIVYGHVNSNVREGDKIKKGQTIATVKGWFNAYGNKDNTHLHLERYVGGVATDPTGYLNSLSKPQQPQLRRVLSSTKVNGDTYTVREGGKYFKNGKPITKDEYDKAFGLQLSSIQPQSTSLAFAGNEIRKTDTSTTIFNNNVITFVPIQTA